jgi:hypothetical protein
MKRFLDKWYVMLAGLFLAGMATVAWAQEATTQSVVSAGEALGSAISEKGGTYLIISLVLSFLLQIFKHKTLGSLVYKIPLLNNPRIRFFLLPVTGALVGLFDKLDSGGSLTSAIYGALMITLPAISAHQGWKAVRPASAKPSNPNK